MLFAVLKIIQLLPAVVCHYLGLTFGFFAWCILPRYRHLVRENLKIAFGNEWTEQKLKHATREHFLRLGSNLLGAAHFFSASEKEVRAHTNMKNIEILQAAFSRKKGVVLMISHIGNWELFAQACFYAKEMPFGTIFQRVHNPHIDRAITGFRQRLGVKTFDRKSGLGAAANFLRTGGVLGVLVDQHSGEAGIWTPFFHKLASTSPLAASLALKTGAAVVPVAIYQTGPAQWDIQVSEEIVVETDDVRQLTYEINNTLEKQIRVSPLDWFWVHARWKLPNPEFLLGHAKRGIYLPAGADRSSLQKLSILVRSPNWLGDAVMSIPAVQAMKSSRPDLRLTVAAPEKIAGLWRRVPEVDDVIPLPPKCGVWRAATLFQGGFAAAVLLPNSLRSALEIYLARIPRRVGFAGHKRKLLLNQIVKAPKAAKNPRHHCARYLHLAERVGAAIPDLASLFANQTAEARSITTDHKPAVAPAIGICAGAEYGPAKQWPIERFRTVMEQVSSRRECVWTVFGVAKDKRLGEQLCRDFPGKVRNLVAQTTLEELIEEISRLRLLLTNDTGTMHLAGFLGIPTVAVFGSTEPALTRPLGGSHIILRNQVECSPCFLRECPLDFRCMLSIQPETATEAVLSLLQTNSNPNKI